MKNEADATLELMSEFGRTIRSQMRAEDGYPSLSQVEALQFVDEHKTPTMRDIAEFLKVKAPSATSLINELVRAKLLVRMSDPTDRRQVRISMTTAGRAALSKKIAKKKEIIGSMLSRLGVPDRQKLNGLLKKLLDAQINS